MTAIAALVTKDGTVWIGGDSAGVDGNYGLRVRKDPKVFINGPFIMGFTTSFRMGQLLHYTFSPPKQPKGMGVDKFMNTIFIEAVRSCLKDGGFAEKENDAESGGTFIVGYKGRMFTIGSDYQVGFPLQPFAAVGCGDDLCQGSLHSTDKLKVEDPKTRIKMALEAAESFSAGVRGPYVIKSLKK